MKVAIVTDTNSGLSVEDGKKLGIYVIPMPFTINGQEYFENIDLSNEEFYEKQVAGADISTSQPAPAQSIDLWTDLLKDYDEIVQIPMSSALSSTYETTNMLSTEDEFEGKVFVVNNQRISITQIASVLEAKAMADKGISGKEIKDYLEKTKLDSTIYLSVDTLKYLKKGGRITPAAAALGTLLKIKPILTIQGGKLDAYAKARTTKQAKSIMIQAIKNDLKERFDDETGNKCLLAVAHAHVPDIANELIDELKETFKDYDLEIRSYELSLSIATHVGIGTVAVGAVKRSEYLR